MAFTDPGAPNSNTPRKISLETVEKAVNSLLRWRNSKLQSQKPKLFDLGDEFVYLVLTLKKIPSKSSVNPHKILLPNSLTSEFSENCLIIDDRRKSGVTKEDAHKKIKAEGIPISNVIKISKLKSDYREFEAKRKLCNSYDVFFADRRVIPLLPGLIGRKFFKKKKFPLDLDLTHKNWKEQIEKACCSAMLFLSTGTCSVVKVARTSMDKHEIVENVVAAIDGIPEVVPKKWKNIRSFHLKLLESVSLPIYQCFPDYTLNFASANVEENKLAEGGVEEANRDMMKGENISRKRGRIHEVRNLDDNIDEDGMDESNTDVDVKDGEEDGEGRDAMANKKVKRGKVQDRDSTEMNGLMKVKKSAKEYSEYGGKRKGAMKKIRVALSS